MFFWRFLIFFQFFSNVFPMFFWRFFEFFGSLFEFFVSFFVSFIREFYLCLFRVLRESSLLPFGLLVIHGPHFTTKPSFPQKQVFRNNSFYPKKQFFPIKQFFRHRSPFPTKPSFPQKNSFSPKKQSPPIGNLHRPHFSANPSLCRKEVFRNNSFSQIRSGRLLI